MEPILVDNPELLKKAGVPPAALWLLDTGFDLLIKVTDGKFRGLPLAHFLAEQGKLFGRKISRLLEDGTAFAGDVDEFWLGDTLYFSHFGKCSSRSFESPEAQAWTCGVSQWIDGRARD